MHTIWHRPQESHIITETEFDPFVLVHACACPSMGPSISLDVSKIALQNELKQFVLVQV
jgi:hypothetical protein